MPCNPETVVGEVLGRRAVKGLDPTATDFTCPFIRSRCPKRSAKLEDEPYPVCTVWRRTDGAVALAPEQDLIFVCPKRFYATDFLAEVIAHCWPGPPPANPQVAPEVTMKGFGNVDFVIADVGDDDAIGQFLSVELQAIDITGSVFKAYQALREDIDLDRRPDYSFNWKNVYKRYVTQLIHKGFLHHHWKSKIVAVIPDQFYRYVIASADFMRTAEVHSDQVNIIFMTYRLEDDPASPGEYRPRLVTVEGTHHASLQNAILYKDTPGKDAFAAQIKRSLVRAVNLTNLVAAGAVPDMENHVGEP